LRAKSTPVPFSHFQRLYSYESHFFHLDKIPGRTTPGIFIVRLDGMQRCLLVQSIIGWPSTRFGRRTGAGWHLAC
jgi:hypothetical protein